MLEMCAALLRRIPRLRFTTHINENARRDREVARLFPWAPTTWRSMKRSVWLGAAFGARAQHACQRCRNRPPRRERRMRVAHCPAAMRRWAAECFPSRGMSPAAFVARSEPTWAAARIRHDERGARGLSACSALAPQPMTADAGAPALSVHTRRSRSSRHRRGDRRFHSRANRRISSIFAPAGGVTSKARWSVPGIPDRSACRSVHAGRSREWCAKSVEGEHRIRAHDD